MRDKIKLDVIFNYDIPEGYRAVEVRRPNGGDFYLDNEGKISVCNKFFQPCNLAIIIEKVEVFRKPNQEDLLKLVSGKTLKARFKEGPSVNEDRYSYGWLTGFTLKPNGTTLWLKDYMFWRDDCEVLVKEKKEGW